SKFVAVQSVGMAMNAAFTWVITGPLHQPTWVPLLPVVFVTPVITFALNRYLVFK
ncbi:GtrA family protein, partial [Escherichia coli]|nr:GtrA family protein [Escherichia coli]